MKEVKNPSSLKVVWSLVCLLLLSSCFSSNAPLIGAGDTPLPSAFRTVALDQHGKISIDAHGHADVGSVQQEGLSYRLTDAKMAKMVTFRMWDTATRTYVAQIVSVEPDAPQALKILYGLADIQGDVLSLYLPGKDPNLEESLQTLGVEKRSGLYVFSSLSQLFQALGALSHDLDKAVVFRARVYSGSSEAVLQSDIASAQTMSASSQPASPPPSSAPVNPTPPAAVDLRQVNPITDARQLATDPGAEAPNTCDTEAANPLDPNRMATGVPIDKVIPRLAQEECERAIVQYPNTVRFRYQLGRALCAGRNFGAALPYLGQAAQSGYPAAFLTLGSLYGSGDGVEQNTDMAELMFRKAIAGGVDAKDQLAQYTFASEGYSNPQVMQAVYDGRLSTEAMKAQSAYWLTFLDQFRNAEGCARILSAETFGKFYFAGQIGELKGVFGALVDAHQGPGTGDFGADAQSGWNAGMNLTQRMLASISRAKEDAQLFYDRHGCDSAVATRFFGNIATAARQM
jgi:TPR repeat protein